MASTSNFLITVNMLKPLPDFYLKDKENLDLLVKEEFSGEPSEEDVVDAAELFKEKKEYLWSYISIAVGNVLVSPYHLAEDLFNFYSNLKIISDIFFKNISSVDRVRLFGFQEDLKARIKKVFNTSMKSLIHEVNYRYQTYLQLQGLQYPRWASIDDIPAGEFANCFEEESKLRFQMIEQLQGISPVLRNEFFKGLVCFRKLPYPDEKMQSLISELKEFQQKLEGQAGFFATMVKKYQQRYFFCLSLLDHRELNLKKALPLKDFNILKDDYYMMYQKKLGLMFEKIPKKFPVEVINVLASLTPKRVTNLEAFLALRLKYMDLKTAHDQIEEILPSQYPFLIPNFMKLDGKPHLKVMNDREFKQIVSAYVSHLNHVENILLLLKSLHKERVELIEELNEGLS